MKDEITLLMRQARRIRREFEAITVRYRHADGPMAYALSNSNMRYYPMGIDALIVTAEQALLPVDQREDFARNDTPATVTVIMRDYIWRVRWQQRVTVAAFEEHSPSESDTAAIKSLFQQTLALLRDYKAMVFSHATAIERVEAQNAARYAEIKARVLRALDDFMLVGTEGDALVNDARTLTNYYHGMTVQDFDTTRELLLGRISALKSQGVDYKVARHLYKLAAGIQRPLWGLVR